LNQARRSGRTCGLFAIYLRFTQAISIRAAFAAVSSDLLGLEISEGALVNMLDDSKQAFARAANLIRRRLLAGTILPVGTKPACGSATDLVGRGLIHHAEDACFVSIPTEQGRGRFLARPPGLLVSDRLAAQMNWAKKDHQVCLAISSAIAQYAHRLPATPASAPGLRKLSAAPAKSRAGRHHVADATLASLCLQSSMPPRCVMRINHAHGAGQ